MTHRKNYDFSRWSTKQLGPQPTERELELAHAFGAAGKQSLALAMAMRKTGVTQEEMKAAVVAVFNTPKGTPQNNHIKALIGDGRLSRDMSLAKREGKSCKHVMLTEDGEKWIKDHGVKGQGKAATAGKTKRKGKDVEPVVDEQVTTVPEEQTEIAA